MFPGIRGGPGLQDSEGTDPFVAGGAPGFTANATTEPTGHAHVAGGGRPMMLAVFLARSQARPCKHSSQSAEEPDIFRCAALRFAHAPHG
jgi:hypothetical protein